MIIQSGHLTVSTCIYKIAFSEKKVRLIHHVLKKHQLPPDVYVILVDNLRIFIFRISFLNLFFIL